MWFVATRIDFCRGLLLLQELPHLQPTVSSVPQLDGEFSLICSRRRREQYETGVHAHRLRTFAGQEGRPQGGGRRCEAL